MFSATDPTNYHPPHTSPRDARYKMLLIKRRVSRMTSGGATIIGSFRSDLPGAHLLIRVAFLGRPTKDFKVSEIRDCFPKLAIDFFIRCLERAGYLDDLAGTSSRSKNGPPPAASPCSSYLPAPAYTVDRVVAIRKFQGQIEFLLSWAEHFPSLKTWEPISVCDCDSLIIDFFLQHASQNQELFLG